MAGGKRAFQGLAPWQPVVAAREVVSHVLLAVFAIGAGIGYLGLMLVFAAELFLCNLVSTAMYPERGVGRHLWDLVKFALAMAFLGIFVVVTFIVASGSKGASPADVLALLPRGAWGTVQWSVVLAVFTLAVRYVAARRDPEPRLAWTRSVLVQSAATFVTVLLMIFVAAFAGRILGSVLPVDAALIAVTAAMRLFFALLVSRMPEREMRELARQPYAG